jgi:hypothetical protein
VKLTSNKWFALITGLAPLILSNIKGGDKIAPVIPVIVSGIQEAEQIKGASGADKKAHVLKTVEAGVAAANATGKVKLDTAEVQAVASDGIDAVIGAVHVVEGAKVVKAPGTSPA